jgi:diguanylate cyclase (GGDEF)-like protein/PAS domain S-box-containing protein
VVNERRSAAMDRTLLDGVLAVVRELGGSSGLGEALDLIVGATAGVLGFGAAAINVTTPEGDLRVDAVVGPPGVEDLLGTRRPLDFWLELLSAAEPWGELRFFSHERDQSLLDRFITWIPHGPVGPEPDAWHPEDSLLAPLWDGERRLVGVLSVDQPRTGRRPDLEQCTVLEVFASQAAKAICDAQSRQVANSHRLEVESRWQLAFEHSPTGAALVGLDGRMKQVNDAFASMLGYSREQLVQRTFADITHPEDVPENASLFGELIAGDRDSYQLEKRYLRADGRVVWGLLHVGAVRDESGAVQTIVSQISDITERRLAEERRTYALTHDPLTGLPNRVELGQQLSEYLAARSPVGVLFCDIDRFKTINDSLGRQAGDELLRAVARRLGEAIPSGCTLGRIGGDEFVVIAPGPGGPPALRRLGEDLVAALHRPLAVGTFQATLGVSIGAAASLSRHQHPDDLMREAEQALLRAKQHGRGLVQVYDPRQDRRSTLEDLQLEQALRLAVGGGDGLQSYLQPIVSLVDESVVGAESLMRWHHPVRGLLLPAEFLAMAEYSGLIVPLGWRMLDLGGYAAAHLPADGRAGNWIAVNVSGSQLGRDLLPSAVRRALKTNDVAPERLHVEITETALVDASAEAIGEVREVADMGVSIALDDFGTGYSSLSLLRDLPISVVKIDRSFIAPIAEDRRTAALVRSVVAMCNALGISTVAEGVETREQLALVTAFGCDHAQGYLFGLPAPQHVDRPPLDPAGDGSGNSII